MTFSGEWADSVLDERNVGGKVPLDVFWRLIDDMAVTRSCHTYHALDLGSYCPHHEETPA